MDDKFYQKVLMDHFKSPRNKKKIENQNFTSGQNNPSCGDKVSIYGIVENDKIVDIGFDGSGCVVSMAAASMLTEKCKGLSVEQALAITKEEILEMVGLKLGPNRMHCALLSLETLHKGLLLYKKK